MEGRREGGDGQSWGGRDGRGERGESMRDEEDTKIRKGGMRMEGREDDGGKKW